MCKLQEEPKFPRWKTLVEKCKILLASLVIYIVDKRDELIDWMADKRDELHERILDWKMSFKEGVAETLRGLLFFSVLFAIMVACIYIYAETDEYYKVSYKQTDYIDTSYVYPIVGERADKLSYTLDGNIIFWAKDFEVLKCSKDVEKKMTVVNVDDYFILPYGTGNLTIYLEVAEYPDLNKTEGLFFTLHCVID